MEDEKKEDGNNGGTAETMAVEHADSFVNGDLNGEERRYRVSCEPGEERRYRVSCEPDSDNSDSDKFDNNDDNNDNDNEDLEVSRAKERGVSAGEEDGSQLAPVELSEGDDPEIRDSVAVFSSEEKEIDVAPVIRGRSQSRYALMKKNLRSKFMNTKLGRRAAMSFIGEGGVSLMHHFKAAAKLDKGEKFSKQLKRRVLRIAVKVQLAIKQKKVEIKDLTNLNKISLRALKSLQRALEITEESKEEVSHDYIDNLEEMFSQFTVELVTIFRPHMTAKNINKTKETLNYWGGKHFLNLLVKDEGYKKERIGAIESIKQMLKDYGKNRARIHSVVAT